MTHPTAAPILFSTDMVRAILRAENPKTMTRRVIKPQPEDGATILGPEYYEPTRIDRYGEEVPGRAIFGVYDDLGEWGIKCPYEAGTRLWVRETWAETEDTYGVPVVAYKAGGSAVVGAKGDRRNGTWREELLAQYDEGHELCGVDAAWRPSIFMPRWASRITLEVTDVRVERLQDISEEDAMAEGCVPKTIDVRPGHTYRECFRDLWESINGKRGFGWETNPWVFAISFRRIEA